VEEWLDAKLTKPDGSAHQPTETATGGGWTRRPSATLLLVGETRMMPLLLTGLQEGVHLGGRAGTFTPQGGLLVQICRHHALGELWRPLSPDQQPQTAILRPSNLYSTPYAVRLGSQPPGSSLPPCVARGPVCWSRASLPPEDPARHPQQRQRQSQKRSSNNLSAGPVRWAGPVFAARFTAAASLPSLPSLSLLRMPFHLSTHGAPQRDCS